jgi:tripartite-type tricarboxylate transporter receptor subunit TctC
MDRLSRLLGQQFVVENGGGASGALGIEAVVKSPADGYTFLSAPSLGVVIVPHLRKVPFEPLKDLVPVTQFVEGTLLVAVHPSEPANSIQELAGVVHIQSDPVTLPYLVAGKAKLLAVLGHERRPDFPNVPLLKEIYPALGFRVWFGIFAPPGAPQSIVAAMSYAMNKVVAIRSCVKRCSQSRWRPIQVRQKP